MSVFRLTGTDRQQALAQAGIDACSFPFDRLLSSLQREGRADIAVDWEDLSRYAASTEKQAGEHSHVHEGEAVAHPIEREVEGRARVLGLFYLPPHTRVVLDTSLEANPALAAEVLLAEAAHAVDYHYLTTEHRRTVVNLLHSDDLAPDADVADGVAFTLDGHTCSWFDIGPYSMWVGEAFMETFIEAFAPSIPVTIPLGHPTSPAVADAVREALVPVGRRVFATRGSRVFHDQHGKLRAHTWYDSPALAQAAGLRACRVCRP